MSRQPSFIFSQTASQTFFLSKPFFFLYYSCYDNKTTYDVADNIYLCVYVAFHGFHGDSRYFQIISPTIVIIIYGENRGNVVRRSGSVSTLNLLVFTMYFIGEKFVGENVRHLAKISSLFPDEFFPDKVSLIVRSQMKILAITDIKNLIVLSDPFDKLSKITIFQFWEVKTCLHSFRIFIHSYTVNSRYL